MGKPGTITIWILGLLVASVVAAMVWQHLRYLDARRNALHDAQDVFHSSDALHAVLFLKLPPDADLFDATGALRAATDMLAAARTVYVGKVAMNGQPSRQLIEALDGDVAWDALALVQFDDRSAYDFWREDAGVRAALGGFATTYVHGMKRSALVNLALVQRFLLTRVMQAVTFRPSVLPFEPAPPGSIEVATDEQRATLLEEGELGRTPCSSPTSCRRARPRRRPQMRSTPPP